MGWGWGGGGGTGLNVNPQQAVMIIVSSLANAGTVNPEYFVCFLFSYISYAAAFRSENFMRTNINYCKGRNFRSRKISYFSVQNRSYGI